MPIVELRLSYTGVRPVESLSVLTSRICPTREDIGMRTASSAGVVKVRTTDTFSSFYLDVLAVQFDEEVISRISIDSD